MPLPLFPFSMASITISLPGTISCAEQAGAPADVGDQLSLTLDTAKFPNLTTNPVIGTITNRVANPSILNPDTNALEAGYDYTVTIADVELPVINGNPISGLDACDLVSWGCESCCTALDARVTALENAPSAGLVSFFDEDTVGVAPPVLTSPAEGDRAILVNGDGNTEYWLYESSAWTLEHTAVNNRATTEFGSAPGTPPSITGYNGDVFISHTTAESIEYWKYDGGWTLNHTYHAPVVYYEVGAGVGNEPVLAGIPLFPLDKCIVFNTDSNPEFWEYNGVDWNLAFVHVDDTYTNPNP